MRNTSGAYYVGGDITNKDFTERLVEYLKDKNNHKVYYDLYSSSVQWIELLEKELAGNVVRLGRVNCRYTEKQVKGIQDMINLPEAFRMVAMDEDLYNRYVKEVDGSYSMIFHSASEFVTKSFGFCIMNEDEFVSTCNAYHISKHMAEVDVFTDHKYRNKGYASMVVNAFVQECSNRNKIPMWNADKGNAASLHLAVKCGFVQTLEEDELWWHEDKKQIEQYLKTYGYSE